MKRYLCPRCSSSERSGIHRSPTHKCRSKRIFGGAKHFCPKCCRANFADRFLVWPPKNGPYLFFCKRWVPYLKSNNVGRHFCPDFQGFCPNFQQIKTIGGALAPTPPTPLLRRPCLPLSAVTVSLHYLPRCLRSRATCDKTPNIGTWSEHLLPCYYCTIKTNSKQSARKFGNLPLQAVA